MKPIATFSVLAALIALGGCQTIQGGGSSSAELSKAYFDCVYEGYNAVVSKSSLPVEEAVDQAIKGCKDEALVYAEALAADLGIPNSNRYVNALQFFRPSVEKETREKFIALITNNDAAK